MHCSAWFLFFIIFIPRHRRHCQVAGVGKIYEFALKPSSLQYSHYYQHHGMVDGNFWWMSARNRQ